MTNDRQARPGAAMPPGAAPDSAGTKRADDGEAPAIPGAPTPSDGLRGPELARAVLDAAKARRLAGTRGGWQRTSGRADAGGDGAGQGAGRTGKTGRRPRGYSGPGPDVRDPQRFGAVLAKLVKTRGWQRPAAEGMVFGAWERVVGPDIAVHCRPVKLVDGELTIEAESTAWATQLRLLARKLLAQIAAEVGPNVVTRLNIHGPAAPSWSRGPRRVAGRGPRDTYG